MAKTTKTDSKNALIKLVTALLPTKDNTIPISTLVLWALDRDYEAAAMFTQCMYWKDRTEDEDGWFYKSYEDWYEEILIAEACARRKMKKLESMGWIQTMVWQVHRTPKLHYRVLVEQVVEDLTIAAESFSEDKRKRQEKKEADLSKRRDRNRDKRAETVDTTGYLQNGGNVYHHNGGIKTSIVAGSIDTKTTSIDYIPEITSKYVKSTSGEGADIGSTGNEGLATDELGSSDNGTASGQNQIQDSGARENDNRSQNPYFVPWDSFTAFREDKDGWAVLPQFPKHKMANFIATRAMQFELLEELDDEFTIKWKPDYIRECYITTSRAGEGLEDFVLGTKKSNGMTKDEWAIEDADDEDIYCTPGDAALRMLRNWGYDDGAFSQETYNSRLKELWDDARTFLEKDNAMVIYSTCPIYEYMDLQGVEMVPEG